MTPEEGLQAVTAEEGLQPVSLQHTKESYVVGIMHIQMKVPILIPILMSCTSHMDTKVSASALMQ